jgi:ABC-type multidrug transport system fused ATPase/permease subunit
MDDQVECAKCEKRPGDVRCSCGERFCEPCFTTKHLVRNSNHKRGGSAKTTEAWNWITGTLSGIANSVTRAARFKEDEAAKWFGLHVEIVHQDRITTIVETPRFSNLMEDSLHFSKISPKRQFPSVTSFVGETGAGKSTLSKLCPVISILGHIYMAWTGALIT